VTAVAPLEEAKQSGAARPDLDAGTMLRLAGGIAMAAEYDTEGAAPLLPWLLAAVLTTPG
jgi:hypothetical protein